MESIKVGNTRIGSGGTASQSHTPWFVLKSPELGKPFYDFYRACLDKSILDRKTKELLMVALSAASECPASMEDHIKAALEAGASKEEITEALLIAVMKGAGFHLLRDSEEIFKKYIT